MKFNLSKNKKGSLYDPITLGAVLLVMGITIFIAFSIWGGFADAIQVAAVGTPGEAQINETVTQLTGAYASIDYMIPLIVIAFMITSLILAFKTGANIVFAFLSLITWGFAILMSLVFKDIFELFAVNFPTVAAQFPILSFVLMNMKWIVLAWLFLISLVMFTRNKQEDADLTSGLAQVYA